MARLRKRRDLPRPPANVKKIVSTLHNQLVEIEGYISLVAKSFDFILTELELEDIDNEDLKQYLEEIKLFLKDFVIVFGDDKEQVESIHRALKEYAKNGLKLVI